MSSRPGSSGSDGSFKSAKSHASGGSTGSKGSKGSMDSAGTTASFVSTFSVDSYVEELKPGIDDDFIQMLKEVQVLGTSFMHERKAQSHAVKRRDPTDVERRLDWDEKMQTEYREYKQAVDLLSDAKDKQEASTDLAKQSKRMSPEAQEKIRTRALRDDELWLQAAVKATELRFAFMKKHPNAFSTPINATHLKAAEDNMNSVKLAMREISTQEQKISRIHTIAAFKAAKNR